MFSIDAQQALYVLAAALAVLVLWPHISRAFAGRRNPAPPPAPLAAQPQPVAAAHAADEGYALMALLQRTAMTRAGNRVIDGAAEAMADDTVAALVRGAGRAKGAQPAAPSPPEAPRPNG